MSVALKSNSRPDGVTLVAVASSASGAAITKYRWSFGDGSPIVETTSPTVVHDYANGTYIAQVEAVNALTRTNVASTSVHVNG